MHYLPIDHRFLIKLSGRMNRETGIIILKSVFDADKNICSTEKGSSLIAWTGQNRHQGDLNPIFRMD